MKNKKKNIKINYLLSVLYRLFSLAIPIITTPYLTGILKASGIGVYNYVSSYSSYFLIFGMLGFGYYGQRLISAHRNDRKQKSIDFWELFISKAFISAAAIILFTIFAIFQPFGEKYSACFYIEIITVASSFFYLNFYLEGHEEFGKITLRDAIIKVLSIVFIFLFVKNESHIWIYALIIAISTMLSNLVLWPYVFKTTEKVRMNELHPLKHVLPCLFLFLPTIAAKIYPIVDKTFIGLITKNDAEVGNYAKSQQIVDTCIGLITALGVVIAPRNSFLFASGQKDKFLENVNKALRFVLLLSIPLCLGCISISNVLVPWYLKGDDFLPSIWLIMLLSPTIIFAGIRNVLGVQYLMSSKQDKKFVISILLGLIANVGLTVLLVFLIDGYGAAIASTISELIICVLMFVWSRKEISFKKILALSWKYIVAGVLMASVCFPLSICLAPNPLHTFLIVLAGVAVYFGLLLFLKDEFVLTYLKIFEQKVSKIVVFLKNNMIYNKIIFGLFVSLVAVTILCYSPILLKFNLNKYVYILWIIYLALSLPFSYKKASLIVTSMVITYLPFLIYVSSSAGYLGRDIIYDDMTKEVFVSAFMMLCGVCSFDYFSNKKYRSIIFKSFYYSALLLSLNVFIEYFIHFDFSSRTYVYALKNSVAPILAIALTLPFIIKEGNMFLKWIEIVGSIFMLVLVILMKCRAVIIVLPIVVIYLLYNFKIKIKAKVIIFISMAVLALTLFIVPQSRNYIIDSILLAGRASDDFNDISSGRLIFYQIALERFAVSPVTGIGSYYVDLEPLNAMVIYGIIGFILLLPSFFAPIFLLIKNSKLEFEFKQIYVIVVILMFSNSFFEAYSPYGPGVKTFILWICSGVLLVNRYYADAEKITDNTLSIQYGEIII